MQQAATALYDDRVTELDVDPIGHVIVGTAPLPPGVLSVWDPESKIVILDESMSTRGRIIALSRWAVAAVAAAAAAAQVFPLISVVPGLSM